MKPQPRLNKRQQRGSVARRTGLLAEWLARLYFVIAGYRVRGHNVRTPFGELDLILQRGRLLVFVEVKWRRHDSSFEAALSHTQRQRLWRAATWYAGRQQHDDDIRFDMLWLGGTRLLCHIPNALEQDFS